MSIQNTLGQISTTIANMVKTRADVNLSNLSTIGLDKLNSGGGANLDLSNLTSIGEAHFANPSLSNLTTEGETHFIKPELFVESIVSAPKRVTCTMAEDGTFTLKAGSTVIVPNGFNSDGSRKFDYYTLTKDAVRAPETALGGSGRWHWYMSSSSINSGSISLRLTNSKAQNIASDTQPTFTTGQYAIWYDTKNNLVKFWNNGSWSTAAYSLPFALTYTDQPSGTTTLQYDFIEYNGFSLFSNLFFLDKDVTVRFPNGLNSDGSFKSIVRTSVKPGINIRPQDDRNQPINYLISLADGIGTFGNLGNGSSRISPTAPPKEPSSGMIWYDTQNNIYRLRSADTNVWRDERWASIGNIIMKDGVLFPMTSLMKPSQVATKQELHNLASTYGLYCKSYHNGSSGYRLYYYDPNFRFLAWGMQWGLGTISQNSSVTINLYSPFTAQNAYIAWGSWIAGSGNEDCLYFSRTNASQMSIWASSGGAGDWSNRQFSWVAMGC